MTDSIGDRPAAFVSGIIIPARIAYLIEKNTRLDEYRRRSRGGDPELDTALHGIHWAAMTWAVTANGSVPRKRSEAAVEWYTPEQIATQTRLTGHAIRLAIREGRLPAEKVDGRWRVTPADYRNFRASHTP